MAKLPLDLKDFKKAASDKHTTTLRHKSGHEIKLVHTALAPEMREKLAALPTAKDMKVREDLAAPQEPVSKRETPKQPVQSDGPNSEPQRLAQGGVVKEDKFKKNAKEFEKGFNSGGPGPKEMVKNIKSSLGFSQGGEVPIKKENYSQSLGHTMVPMTHEEAKAYQEAQKAKASPTPKAMADGGGVEPEVEQISQAEANMVPPPSVPANAQPAPPPVTINIAPPQAAPQPAPMPGPHPTPMQGPAPMPEAQAPALQPQQMPEAPQAPAQPEALPTASADSAMMSGLGDRLKGLGMEAKAMGDLGNKQAAIQQENIDHQQQIMNDFTTLANEHKASLDRDIAAFEEKKIDANRYMSSMGTGGRIKTAIGLILGGMGAAVNGRENPVMSYINKQIDNDINAQKAEMDKKATLVGYNFKKFGDMKDAMEMTKAMQASIVASQLGQAAAQSQDPIAKARLLQARGEIFQKEVGPRLAETAARQTLNKAMASGDPNKLQAAIQMIEASPDASKALKDMATDMKERFIPGVGLAQNKDDVKTIKEVEDRRKLIQSNLKQVKAMIISKGTHEFLGSHNADLDRLTDQIATDMAKLQDPNSVARPGEVELVKKGLVESGIFQQDDTALDKLSNFAKEVDKRADSAYKVRGVNLPAKEEIRTMNGVKYKRVQGGWKKAE